MSSKRRTSQSDRSESSQKKTRNLEITYLQKTLEESGLILKDPPEKIIAKHETIYIKRNIKKNLQKHYDYPRNASEFIGDLTKKCEALDTFKHYLFPNVVKILDNGLSEHLISDSVLKILLGVPILQRKMIDYIFTRAINLAVESNCLPWIQMILKCVSSLDCIVSSEVMATHLIDLLEISTEKMVRLEIITAIPDILGDKEHNNVAIELCRILSQDHDLIPAVLDCVSNLCLSDEQYEQIQEKTLNILLGLSKCSYFPCFVKVLLMRGRMNENGYLKAVQGLRNAISWPTTLASTQEIASSQVLTANAIRNSMVSCKLISNAWLKVIANCKMNTDHKPFDFIIVLILYSTSEERQKQLENLLKKQIKLNVLKENLLDDVFEKYKPILKNHLKDLISLTNIFLKSKADPILQSFASHIYMLMLSNLDEYCQTIVAELLQLGLYCKPVLVNILEILNNVASKDISLLKPQCLQMLTLLDRMDDMTLGEIRSVMNLISALAYKCENSLIRDDIHMIIRKELGSSNPSIKTQGILAGIHAVKYLMASNSNDNDTLEVPENISYTTFSHLSEGNLREAAQIIELISRSTQHYPEMIALYYDELCCIINSVDKINKNFLAWLTDAVTNDLEKNFIVDSIELERIGEIKLSMQYGLLDESDVDQLIAINIAGLALNNKGDVSVAILSPLFKLVQTLRYTQDEGKLTSIDALLGCPVVMPKVNIDEVKEMETNTISSIIDCLIYCVNWFRELLNAFATQTDSILKEHMFKRIANIEELEDLIVKILILSKISYKPPKYILHGNVSSGKKLTTSQNKKQKLNDTALPETVRSQFTQDNHVSVKNQLQLMHTLPIRKMNLNLIHLLNIDLEEDRESVKILQFLLKSIKQYLEETLVSKIKRHTFLTKQETSEVYDAKKAEKCANLINKTLPKLMDHVNTITAYLDKNVLQMNEIDYCMRTIEYLSCLDIIYNILTIYFKWIGFKNQHSTLLKTSLRTVASAECKDTVSLKDCVLNIAKYLQKHEKYCVQISIAAALLEFLIVLQEHCNDIQLSKILRNVASNFLSTQWKTPDGSVEKGLLFNQNVDRLASTYLINNEIVTLKTITIELAADIQHLKSKNDTLSMFKSINKGNFPVLYRNLGNALCEVTKTHLNQGLSNSEHLNLWKDVATIMKCMSDISKSLENRNNLSAFLKKSIPIIKMFISQGLPVIEVEFKSNTQEILEILKLLQQSTRFLQSLCCHSRLKKDTVLMSKVPYIRQLLETLIYKVKAVLVANKCSEAFWLGNLKNKNIHGEVIQTQQSVESEDTAEDCDDQLPEDVDVDDSDDEMLEPDSKSVSDIV
ncbi:PREDICTED: Fanconi anemia group D2 protein homolog [Papilio xuthus]|uniref:Fanconi anemia group D2 protein homolog n=1 Tax=Papilio xuthus TaxID=66420 RepID=A0AAJ6ZAH6_PAPXU|nr:PREDICTED: Fanconi anemia group D2 protein homolog [Papilio xuthus]